MHDAADPLDSIGDPRPARPAQVRSRQGERRAHGEPISRIPTFDRGWDIPRGVMGMTPEEFRHGLRKLVDSRPVSVLITVDESGRAVPRPMGATRVDDDLTVWYATGATSRKCRHIATDPRVTIYWEVSGESMEGWDYACLYGEATVLTDQATKNDFWSDPLKEYFPGGPTDPEYAIIRVTANRIEGVLGGEYPAQGVDVR